MPTTLTIRHVPDDVRDELAARAARSGRSLQEYMLCEVKRMAATPTIEDFMAAVREDKELYGVDLDIPTLLADRDADRR